MAIKHKTAIRSTPKTIPTSRSRSALRSVPSSLNAKNKPQKVAKAPNLSHLTKSCNKTQLVNLLCEMTGQPRKSMQSTLACLQQIIGAHMKKQGPGEFVLPGILKMKLKSKPATKAKKGINPFTGEPTIFKAKPARNVVKITALKKLKALAN